MTKPARAHRSTRRAFAAHDLSFAYNTAVVALSLHVLFGILGEG